MEKGGGYFWSAAANLLRDKGLESIWLVAEEGTDVVGEDRPAAHGVDAGLWRKLAVVAVHRAAVAAGKDAVAGGGLQRILDADKAAVVHWQVRLRRRPWVRGWAGREHQQVKGDPRAVLKLNLRSWSGG